jgi:formylglycine-generating enzyme required for sulfatase activity/tRNA A-37 threonylcarbamoyl transferase component Bud32
MLNNNIKNYLIKTELGRGGMAEVYLALDNKFDTNVAVKLLNKEYVHNDNIRKRFLAEAKNMYRMSHPNIIKVTDLIDDGDTVAFVMEYIEGETLKDYLESKGKLGDEEIKALFTQMLDAVGYVHEQNLVHRDIKPSNFMITPSGKIKLLDFGIAKNLNRNSIEYTMTENHQLMGTVMYMSPEHIKSTKEVTFSTDIYSLGVLLWQMVAGKKPYDSSELSIPEIQVSILKEPLSKLNNNWDRMIQLATAKDPGSRYLNCNEFLSELNKTSFRLTFEDISINVNKIDLKLKNQEEQKIKEPTPSSVRIDPLGIEFIWVEGGTFQMGEDENIGATSHKVTLDGYYMGKYPITQAQWQKVMGNNPSYYKDNGSDCPVEKVNWFDCQEFIERINNQLGTDYRLPTEAEWEFAARGGNLSKGFEFAGSNIIDEVAWYKCNRIVLEEEISVDIEGKKELTKYLGTSPVGTKKANEIGLYDMSGNVLEWCADWYGYYSSTEQINPKGPASGAYRVCRGGSNTDISKFCRIDWRDRGGPTYRGSCMGLRIVSQKLNKDVEDTIIDIKKIDFKLTNQEVKTIIEPKLPKIKTDPLGLEFILVEGGTFQMGEDGNDGATSNKVTLDGYYIGKYPVTQAQWQKVMGNNPSRFKDNGLNCPVDNVSWLESLDFIARINKQFGTNYRLPYETEWEFAAKGGNLSKRNENFSVSKDEFEWYSAIRVNVKWRIGFGGRVNPTSHLFYSTEPVGKDKANDLGIFDMSSSVWEWCDEAPIESNLSPLINSNEPPNVSTRSIRGGSWDFLANTYRQTYPYFIPDFQEFIIGLRLVSPV